MTQRRRMMSVSELCRLQGLPPNRVRYRKAKVSRMKFARAIGNIMSVSVLVRLLPALLNNAGLAATGRFDEVTNFFWHRLRSQIWDEATDQHTAKRVA